MERRAINLMGYMGTCTQVKLNGPYMMSKKGDTHAAAACAR